MSKKDEAMKLALEALEYIEHNYMSLPAPAEKAITALREALAEQPAQQEICGGCKGSGWVTRDPDIGTDQECFVCEGKGTVEPEHPAQQEPVAWPAGLIERIKAAEQRIQYGHAPRRIPADPTDVDLVLAEVRYLLEGKQPPFWVNTPPPAQRTWVGLTDEEIERACVPLGAAMLSFTEVARAIEAKLKEKNT